MAKLIVFLGNYGKEYENTRHNAAFALFKRMYPDIKLSNKFHSLFADEGKAKLMLPMTYMNKSGIAVSEAKKFYKLSDEDILICHDDTELDTGKAVIQKGGAARGHNGLRSIIEMTGSSAFSRLRIGIGRPKHNDMRIHVLSPFSQSEQIALETAFDECEKLISSFLNC